MTTNIKKVLSYSKTGLGLLLFGLVMVIISVPNQVLAADTCNDGVTPLPVGAFADPTAYYTTFCKDKGGYTPPAGAPPSAASSDGINLPGNSPGNDICGGGADKSGTPRKTVEIQINIGCRGDGNPIYDMVTALLRFLSITVGILMIGSAIVAGIQFAMSGDNPQAKQKAIKRLTSVASAFFVFIMTYAALNFLIPGGLF